MYGKMAMVAVALASCVSLFAGADEDKRLSESATIVKEIQSAGDNSIPKSLFEKSICAIVVPSVKKAGFIVGAKYGRGFVSCRQAGGWSAPSGVRIEGGSFGLQIGGAETDVIMLVMNDSGKQRLLASKFTLGGEASAAAGPVGRETTAQTDATMRAEILSWSRSRGVFGGISLDGATLRPDTDVNKALYGASAEPPAILAGKFPPPASSKELLSLLAQFGGTAQKK